MVVESRDIFALVSVFLLFFVINLDPTLSTTFLLFLVVGVLLALLDQKVTYRFESGNNRFMKIAIGIFSVFIFYILAAFLLPIIGVLFGFQSVVGEQSIQALFSSNLLFAQFILAGVAWVVILVWGFLIPIVENIYTIRIYEWLIDKFGTLGKSIAGIVAALTIASIMALFHIQAKGASLEATPALFVTLLFFLMGIILTIYTGDMVAFTAAHITANLLALKGQLSSLAGLSPTILIALGIGIFIITLRSGAFQNILKKVGG